MLPEEQKINVEKLLEELRSGNHNQGESVLKDVLDGFAKYCCLGIAAEFVLGRKFSPSLTDSDRDYITGGNWALNQDDANAFGFLTELNTYEVQKIRRLADDNTIRYSTRHTALMYMNDNGFSFERIADLMEEFGWNVYGEVK